MGRGPTNENTNMYFQARKKAATYNERLWSREGAAELLGISVSTLADYELGNTKVVPVDKVVLMADLYNAPELITGYCMRECPVHGFLPLATEEKSLEGIALRLLQNFNEDSLKNMRDSLIEITADGKITKDELPALEKIIGQLEKMAEVISEMKIAGEKYLNGKQLSFPSPPNFKTPRLVPELPSVTGTVSIASTAVLLLYEYTFQVEGA